MKRTTFKGFHFSWFPWPKRLKRKNHTFTISIEDPAMWEYVFNPLMVSPAFVTAVNQWDWNKLIGIKKNLFRPHKNSVMLGWRWNPIDNCLELCPYWHDENGGAHFDYEPLQIPKIELLHCKGIAVIFNQMRLVKLPPKISIIAKGKGIKRHKTWKLPQNAYIGKGWMIAPWFGGQETAQKKMVFNIEYSK